MIKKLDLKTPNFTDENIEKLAALFPNCVTEASDAKGNVTKAIDFDLLKQELSDNIVDGPRERYQINWPGKREALVSANTPINKTLRPCREESVDFDTTENLYIEGDNLEALKLLQESYLGKIKMIYIDPPYNTGKDFVYKDNFTVDKGEYEQDSEQRDEEGGRLVANFESNGRYHSDWMSMLYPRLKLARNLLNNEGVIFISIDDNEVVNLRKICDEIFGEDNFVAQIIWKKRSTPPNDKIIGAQHDYICAYAKNIEKIELNLRERTEAQLKRYKNPDKHTKGPWAAGDLMANIKGGRYVESLYYPIINPATAQEHYPSSNGNWRFNNNKINKLIENNEIYFGEDGKGRPKLKRFLSEVKSGITWTTLWDFAPLNTSGSNEMASLLGNLAIFDNPKPAGLIEELVKLGSINNCTILDFFSGSATTAHAAMQLNTKDNGNRKFIMVQLPEETDEKSEAYKAGYETIPEIGKERIRRAGQKIKEENADKEGIEDLDTGFRVLKIDSSNMKDVYYSPDEVTQVNLFDTVDNIKEDRSTEDLLFQVLLDWGVDLSLPIVREEIQGKTVYFVDEDTLAACFEDDIDEAFVKELASREVMRVVFKDSGFAQDDIKSNVEQIFKQLSPETEVKAI